MSTEECHSIHSVMQSNWNSWKIDTFREAVNFELIICILKTSRLYLFLAKVIICSELVLKCGSYDTETYNIIRLIKRVLSYIKILYVHII